jgi:hypothetical protein
MSDSGQVSVESNVCVKQVKAKPAIGKVRERTRMKKQPHNKNSRKNSY